MGKTKREMDRKRDSEKVRETERERNKVFTGILEMLVPFTAYENQKVPRNFLNRFQ